MKNKYSTAATHCLTAPTILYFTMFVLAIIFEINGKAAINNNFFYLQGFPNEIAIPDTIPPDSTTYNFNDTVSICIDGLDSIIILYDMVNDSMGRTVSTADIIITLKDYATTPSYGINGYNLQDFYLISHANPINDVFYAGIGEETPGELLIAFAPKTLRFPGGSSCKFRHAFGSMNSPDFGNPFHDLKNGDYGVNIEELIPIYDATENFYIAPAFSSLVTDYLSIYGLRGATGNNLQWMNISIQSSFIDYFNEWYTQQHFNPATFMVAGIEQIWNEPLAINYFIEQVK